MADRKIPNREAMFRKIMPSSMLLDEDEDIINNGIDPESEEMLILDELETTQKLLKNIKQRETANQQNNEGIENAAPVSQALHRKRRPPLRSKILLTGEDELQPNSTFRTNSYSRPSSEYTQSNSYSNYNSDIEAYQQQEVQCDSTNDVKETVNIVGSFSQMKKDEDTQKALESIPYIPHHIEHPVDSRSQYANNQYSSAVNGYPNAEEFEQKPFANDSNIYNNSFTSTTSSKIEQAVQNETTPAYSVPKAEPMQESASPTSFADIFNAYNKTSEPEENPEPTPQAKEFVNPMDQYTHPIVEEEDDFGIQNLDVPEKINIMELLIEEKIDQAMKKFRCCECSGCRKEIFDIALDTVGEKMVDNKPDTIAIAINDTGSRGAVTTALVKAILRVKAKPSQCKNR